MQQRVKYGLPLELGLKQRACDDVTMKQWTESTTNVHSSSSIHSWNLNTPTLQQCNKTPSLSGKESYEKLVQDVGSCKYIFNGDKYIIVRSPDAVHMYGKGNAKDNVHTSLKCLVGSGREARYIKVIRGMIGPGCLAAKGAFSCKKQLSAKMRKRE